jgi:predicted nuclease of predicted toxin-antitoxin system
MIRYLADACIHDGIVSGCRRREPTMDFQSANEAKLKGVKDPDVLALASTANRILVSSDLKTMPRHFADFLEKHGQSPGVFLVKQNSPLADIIEYLIVAWAASDAEEWTNRIMEIPPR